MKQEQIIININAVKDFDSDFNNGDGDHYDDLELIKDYLVENYDFSHGGGVKTIDDNTDFEIKGEQVIVDVCYYDDSDNPDFNDDDE